MMNFNVNKITLKENTHFCHKAMNVSKQNSDNSRTSAAVIYLHLNLINIKYQNNKKNDCVYDFLR